MVTILLEKILTLLTGWLNAFTEHATNVLAKLNLIEEDTSNLPDIKTNTDSIVSNTASVITPINNIKSNTDSIKTNTDSIKNDTAVIKNNINTISTNTGTASAFCEDIANNTLDIANRVVTIGSDTTQLRTNSDNMTADLHDIKQSLQYYFLTNIVTEDSEGSITNFDTDLQDYLQKAIVTIPSDANGISSINIINCKVNLLDSNTISSIDTRGDSTMRYGVVIDKPGSYCIISANNDAYLYAKKIVNGVYSNNIYVQTSTTKFTQNITINPGEILIFYDAVSSDSLSQAISYLTNCQIAKGSDITTFEAYNGNTQSITFTSPITDGAEVDLLSGIVKINTSPVTYDSITPIAIRTFKGVNNIYSDIGDMSVTYRETLKHYLDKQNQ